MADKARPRKSTAACRGTRLPLARRKRRSHRVRRRERRLHALIRTIAREPIASQLVEQLNSRITRFQFRTAVIPGRLAATADEHDAVVAAITERDPELAERVMRHHLGSVADALERTTAET
jgi:DNA-binding FadR family transcriptional regulator